MCRLLGIYGEVDFWKELVLSFRHLAESGQIPPTPGTLPGHKDGWGMARENAARTEMVLVGREMKSADQSEKYVRVLDSISDTPQIFLCHLRKASPKIPITPANVHPFLERGWAFMHNGTVFEAQRLERDPSLRIIADDSDSEYLFHYLLTRLADSKNQKSDQEKLQKGLADIRLDFTSVNMFMSNGRNLYAVRYFSRHPDYYTLYYYTLDRGVIICSEPLSSERLSPEAWQSLSNQSIMKISGFPPEIEILSFGN